MDLGFLKDYYMFYVLGVKNTIILSIFSVVFGTILGTILSLMKISRNKILNSISTAYIEIFRGTPLLVQIMIIYYGLPINVPKFPAGILALTLNSGAYVAEIIRGGIMSVDSGQMEAARCLGLNRKMAMRFIIIPQAVKNVIPALVNEFIVVIKESAAVYVIGVHDLMYNADTVRGNTYKGFMPFFIAAAIYFTLTFSLSKGMSRIEGRLRAGDKSI